MEELHKRVIDFIEQFYKFDKENVIKLFTEGMCYWFAWVLYTRFKDDAFCVIAYDPVANHFCCMIDTKFYDITGEIIDESIEWYSWAQYQRREPLEAARIHNDCVLKLNENGEAGTTI